MCDSITAKYREVLDSFIKKIKEDRLVIAAILAGSLYHDKVWRKSDIDLILIVDDPKKPYKFHSLIENDIIINTGIYDRSQFKREYESALESSSWILKSTLLFSKDETLNDLLGRLSVIADNDRDLLLLRYGTLSVAGLAKSQKFLYIKQDPLYSMYMAQRNLVNELASIEVLLNGGVPFREVVDQALSIHPQFFNSVYTQLLQLHKDENVMDSMLRLIESYLEERTMVLFRLILDILQEAGMEVAMSEIHRKLSRANIDPALLAEACEWLVEKKVIQKLSSPVRLTTKSRMQVDEAAYYYEGGNQ